MKPLLYSFLIALVIAATFYFLKNRDIAKSQIKSLPVTVTTKTQPGAKNCLLRLKNHITIAKFFVKKNHFSTDYLFFIDMSLPAGKNRFFIYNNKDNSITVKGLVAHGSCDTRYLAEAHFSNEPGCGCSSIGKYKIGYSYQGQFGKAFKLYGLDSTNSNAFKRTVVLHAYDCIPDKEVYPLPVCNSLGCPMVSYKFLDALTGVIESSKKPILLWIYN